MTNVICTIVKRMDLTTDSFADITASTCSAINGVDAGLEVVFDGDLTAEQVTRVKIRVGSANTEEETTLIQAYQAIATIRNFNNLATPTNAQTLAEVKFLGTVCIGIIKNVLGDYAL